LTGKWAKQPNYYSGMGLALSDPSIVVFTFVIPIQCTIVGTLKIFVFLGVAKSDSRPPKILGIPGIPFLFVV
jgi:hypothetical protein